MQQDDFDPYRKWLGIQPKDQPPNHYRLLALELFEDDPDTISNAADRQMAHLRTFQAGTHSELSQRLLNECAAARVCLLNRDAKASYDADLRAKAPVAPATAKAEPSPKRSSPATRDKPARALPVAQPLATPTARAAPRSAPPAPNAKLPQAHPVRQVAGSDVPVLIDIARQPSGAKRRSRRFAPLASAGGLAVGALVIAVIVMSARNRDRRVPAGTPESAAMAQTSTSATSAPKPLTQDAIIPEPVSAPAVSPMPPLANGAGDQSDAAADAEASKADAPRRSEARDADMRDETSETAPPKSAADVPDFFTEDDSGAAEPKAASMSSDEDFFTDDDEIPAPPAGDANDSFDSKN